VADIKSVPSGDWHVAQAEVDWLVSDGQRYAGASGEGSGIIEVDGQLGASPSPDEDAEGEDDLNDQEGTNREPSAGKGVEQGAIVSLYFIPLINRAQEFCFGRTERGRKNR
jgi:hypothetical protein